MAPGPARGDSTLDAAAKTHTTCYPSSSRYATTGVRLKRGNSTVSACPKGIQRGKRRPKRQSANEVDTDTGPIIQNMVFTALLGTPLNLRFTARKRHSRVDLNPHKFASSIFRSMWPKTTVLLFSTGKVVITGCKSRWCAYISVTAIIRMLIDIGIPIMTRKIILQNVVGSTNVGEALDTDYLAHVMQEQSSYETDLFPGLVYRPYNANVTILCFKSGKMVLTGCKDEEDIAAAGRFISQIKDESAKGQTTSDPIHNYSKRSMLG
jgi:transcription initiation factor TFIID TATA-box-binding protein